MACASNISSLHLILYLVRYANSTGSIPAWVSPSFTHSLEMVVKLSAIDEEIRHWRLLLERWDSVSEMLLFFTEFDIHESEINRLFTRNVCATMTGHEAVETWEILRGYRMENKEERILMRTGLCPKVSRYIIERILKEIEKDDMETLCCPVTELPLHINREWATSRTRKRFLERLSEVKE